MLSCLQILPAGQCSPTFPEDHRSVSPSLLKQKQSLFSRDAKILFSSYITNCITSILVLLQPLTHGRITVPTTRLPPFHVTTLTFHCIWAMFHKQLAANTRFAQAVHSKITPLSSDMAKEQGFKRHYYSSGFRVVSPAVIMPWVIEA
ncbi:hypothetical protein VTO42DRAFT_1570 [Malbranchea cinnamomea]